MRRSSGPLSQSGRLGCCSSSEKRPRPRARCVISPPPPPSVVMPSGTPPPPGTGLFRFTVSLRGLFVFFCLLQLDFRSPAASSPTTLPPPLPQCLGCMVHNHHWMRHCYERVGIVVRARRTPFYIGSSRRGGSGAVRTTVAGVESQAHLLGAECNSATGRRRGPCVGIR